MEFLLGLQDKDGRWTGEKWHSSWIYTTSQVILALVDGRRTQPAARRAVAALLGAQDDNGGWGARQAPTAGETGYATLALLTAVNAGLIHPDPRPALRRATDWLGHWHDRGDHCNCHLWIGKDLYCPTRVDDGVALTALHAVRFSRF